MGIARDDLWQVNGPNVYALSYLWLCLWSSRWIENLESVIDNCIPNYKLFLS